MAMKTGPKNLLLARGLRVFVDVLLHRGERIEPRDARIPPPVVPDVDPGHSPRRDELEHAQPDAREAEDQARYQFDHTDTISMPDGPHDTDEAEPHRRTPSWLF
jgi:hypothetical protein